MARTKTIRKKLPRKSKTKENESKQVPKKSQKQQPSSENKNKDSEHSQDTTNQNEHTPSNNVTQQETTPAILDQVGKTIVNNEIVDDVTNDSTHTQKAVELNDTDPSEIYTDVKSKFNVLLKEKFQFFEKYSDVRAGNGKCYFSDGCCQSTYDPQVINFPEYTHNVPELMELGNIVNRDVNLKQQVYKDMKNRDVNIVPLEGLVTVNDSHNVYLHSRMELPINEQIKDVRKHVYEFCLIDKIKDTCNCSIRQIVFEFFKKIFIGEEEHIKSILNSDQTFVLMIINRTLKPHADILIDHIIASVIFTADQYASICIDYITTGKSYYSHGYGTLILHMAQVIAIEYNLNFQKKQTSNDLRDNQMTYTYCRKELLQYYLSIGFEEMSIDDFEANKDLSEFAKRFQLSEWKNDDIENRLKIVKKRGTCPRVLNFVSVNQEINIEETLYDENYLNQRKNNKVNEEVRKVIKKVFPEMVKRIRLHPETESDLHLLKSSIDMNDFIKRKFNAYLMIPLGKWFNYAFKEQRVQFDNMNFKESQTMLLAMEHLQIQFLSCGYPSGDLNSEELWICVQCTLCKKKSFVKKSKDSDFVTFFLKVIYSVWYQHVFSYQANSDNPFDTMNPEWNICNGRRGKYLQQLRDATRFDISVLSSENDGEDKIFKWKKYLQFFLVGLKVNYTNIVDAFIHYISSVKGKDKNIDTVSKKRQRKSLVPDYSKELVIGTVPTSKKQTVNNNHRAHSKSQKKLKQKRYDKENDWNVTFYNDLEKQLTIEDIEYVDVNKTTKFYQESLNYFEDRNKLADNNYINHWGEVQHENHYVGHCNNGDTLILEDEWFKQYHEDGKFSHYTISSGVFKKINQRVNRRVSLNDKDKKKIKKHVEDVKGMCEIQKIKKIKRKKHEADQYEYIEFLEDQGSESNHGSTRKIKHVSASRYDYVGFDANGRTHFLSKDWLELNFKEKHPKLYKDICKLDGNKTIIIPSGSSDLKDIISHIEDKDLGPKIKYTQDSDPSCLFTSLANALDFLGYSQLGQKLVEVYYKEFHNQKSSYFSINDVLRVTKYNKYRNKSEHRFQFLVSKVKKPNALTLLPPEPIEIDVIYHCVLSNHHSIAICNGLIFDPILQNSMILNEKNLRISSQSNTSEVTSRIILKAYKYST